MMTEGRQVERDTFFNQLYQGQFHKMWKYALAIQSNPNLATEVVQDSFMEALLHIDELMTYQRPEQWLQKTVKNKARHILRDQARDAQRLMSLSEDDIAKVPASDELSQVEEDEQAELAEAKRKIADALTPKELALLKRIVIDKASYKELAQETGLPLWTCQKRIQRIRAKLRKIFPGR